MIWVVQELIYHEIREAKPLKLAYGMIVVVYISTSLAPVYIMHQRPRITRVLAEYAGGEESLS